MNSILRENYSIRLGFYLFSFLLFLTGAGRAQEILWSVRTETPQPGLRLTVRESGYHQVLLYGPFANQVKSLRLSDGEETWSRTFPERIPYPPLPLAESVVVQGDQGTIWALTGDAGYIMWEARASQPTDFPVAPPRFRENSIFTLSKNGRLQKFDNAGRPDAPIRHPNDWGERKAQTVPLRSSRTQLTFLDQSGRLVSYEPATLVQTVRNLWSDGGELTRTQGQSREALGGALSPDRAILYATELPGLLRAYSVDDARELWARRLAAPEHLFSRHGELLAIPTLVTTETLSAIITVDRTHFTAWSSANGRPIRRFQLPSEAVTAPIYDSEAKKWWILCLEHLLSLDQNLGSKIYEIPTLDTPYSLAAHGDLVVLGSAQGRIYGIKLPEESSSVLPAGPNDEEPEPTF